ncbi:hypothetical protein SCUP234_07448 [Seiridium cupressi]
MGHGAQPPHKSHDRSTCSRLASPAAVRGKMDIALHLLAETTISLPGGRALPMADKSKSLFGVAPRIRNGATRDLVEVAGWVLGLGRCGAEDAVRKVNSQHTGMAGQAPQLSTTLGQAVGVKGRMRLRLRDRLNQHTGFGSNSSCGSLCPGTIQPIMTALRSGTDVFRSTTKVIFDGKRSNVGWLTSHDDATLQKAGPPTVFSLLSQHGGCSGSSHACVPQAYPDHWTNGSLGQGSLETEEKGNGPPAHRHSTIWFLMAKDFKDPENSITEAKRSISADAEDYDRQDLKNASFTSKHNRFLSYRLIPISTPVETDDDRLSFLVFRRKMRAEIQVESLTGETALLAARN